MTENLPIEIALPLAIVLIGAAFYQRRHALMVWLGFKEKQHE